MSTENSQNYNISTIAFEGAHRAGKGTNIQFLCNHLEERGIPHITLRGDGSRLGIGRDMGDPYSPYWQKLSTELHEKDVPKEKWNFAAYLLAREFIIQKNVYMPRLLENSHKDKGVVVLDRSVLSRTLIPREMVDPCLWDSEIKKMLYSKPGTWKGKEIKVEDVTPDIIFDLVAPLEVLLSRLDKNDPKYEFRKRNLTERYDWYINTEKYLPEEIRSKVVKINTDRSPTEIFCEIASIICEKLKIE